MEITLKNDVENILNKQSCKSIFLSQYNRKCVNWNMLFYFYKNNVILNTDYSIETINNFRDIYNNNNKSINCFYLVEKYKNNTIYFYHYTFNNIMFIYIRPLTDNHALNNKKFICNIKIIFSILKDFFINNNCKIANISICYAEKYYIICLIMYFIKKYFPIIFIHIFSKYDIIDMEKIIYNNDNNNIIYYRFFTPLHI